MGTEDTVWRESTERITIEFHQPNFMYKREISEADQIDGDQSVAACAEEPRTEDKLGGDKSGSDDSSQEDRMSCLVGSRRRSSMFPRQPPTSADETDNYCCTLKPSTEIKIIQVVLIASILLSTAFFLAANFLEF